MADSGYYDPPSGNFYPIGGLGGLYSRPPTTQPKPTSYAWMYGGGGHGGTLPPLKWTAKYQVPGAPQWWAGMKPSGTVPAAARYASQINALIPFMSPEDQRAAAVNLSRLFPKAFKYDPETTAYEPPGEPTTTQKQYLTSAKRAQDILNTLTTARGNKIGNEGEGYKFLRQVASTMRDFGGAEGAGQTRKQKMYLASALDPLLAEAQGSKALGAYSSAVQKITQPYFTSGGIPTVGKSQTGEWVFGKRNKEFVR